MDPRRAGWMLRCFVQLLLLYKVYCSIDGIITEVEEQYEIALVADGTGKSSPKVWYDYKVNGSSKTFMKVQLDMLITNQTWHKIIDDEGKSPRVKRNAVLGETKLWPDNRVPYKLDDKFSAKEKLDIVLATTHWMTHTCIVFEPATEDDFNMITFNAVDDVCESVVGMMQGNQPINLAPPCRTKDVVIHELGHSLGLFHEHMRADRDKYVTINYTNINESLHYNFYKMYKKEYNDHDKPYDYRSIMHYSKYAFSKDRDNNLTTVVPTNLMYLDIIGEATEASFLDIQIVNAMYKCSAGCMDQDCPDGAILGKQCRCYCNVDGKVVQCDAAIKCKAPALDPSAYNFYLREFREIEDLNRKFPIKTILHVEFKDRACGDKLTELTCSDGHWQGEPPKCLDEKSCRVSAEWEEEYVVQYLGVVNSTDDIVAEENDTLTGDDYVLSRHKVLLTCLDFPDLNSTLTCNFGQWEETPVACVMQGCEVSYPPEGRYSLSIGGKNLRDDTKVPHDTQVLASCDELDPSFDKANEDANITCYNGAWMGTPPSKCPEGRKDCPLIVNSTVIGLFYGGYTVTCIHGYELNMGDKNTFSCSYGGEWEPVRPTCTPASCALSLEDIPGTVTNPSGVTLSSRQVIKHRNDVTVTCPHGMFPDSVTITCHLGNWSTETGMFPQCKQVNCPQPPVQQRLKYQPMRKQFVYKDTVTVKRCRRNLEFFGEKTLTCQQDGTWSGKAGCRKYCGRGVESYVNLKDREIKAKPEKTIRLGNFSPVRCKNQCRNQQRFLCMSAVFGYDTNSRRYVCQLYKIDPTKSPHLEGTKSFWTLSHRTCKSS